MGQGDLGPATGALFGRIQAAYMALSKGQVHNYEAVKAAILDQVGLSTERYRQKLWAARWMGNQRPLAFAQRLGDWAIWCLWPSTQRVDEIMDTVVLEQFLQGLLPGQRTGLGKATLA